MFILLCMFLISSIMSSAIIITNSLISKTTQFSRTKKSPFECGFDPLINPRLPFSIHFFLISLMFLIFDIEITLLLPSIMLYLSPNKFMLSSLLIFVLILLTGLYLEYMENAIDWKT